MLIAPTNTFTFINLFMSGGARPNDLLLLFSTTYLIGIIYNAKHALKHGEPKLGCLSSHKPNHWQKTLRILANHIAHQ